MIKVTVAIPVYNGEKYLTNCLESIIHQSLEKDEYEVIIVDDFSNDGTREMITSYQEQYPQLIKTIFRKVNSGGASVPRNEAIAHAQGEYIYFVDADDYLAEETLDRMYNYGRINNSDVIIGKYVGLNDRKVPKAIFKDGNISNAEIIENSLFYAVSALKMFKMNKIKELNLIFLKEATIAEDQVFTVAMLCNTERISVLAEYDCYFISKHDGQHLSDTELNPQLYFLLMSKIINTIYEGSVGDLEYKHRLAGKYITRIFRHGQFKNFYKKGVGTQEEKEEWLSLFSSFLNLHVPKEADQYVTPIFEDRIKYIRENDLYKIIIAEKLISVVNEMKSLKKENQALKKEIQLIKNKGSH